MGWWRATNFHWLVALANMYTRTNTALGIESQGFAAACGLEPLAVPALA